MTIELHEEIVDLVKSILPALEVNCKTAYDEWYAGYLSKGALVYVENRYSTAIQITKAECFSSIDGILRLMAPITIDLRCAVNSEFCEPELLDKWLSFFVEHGFTDTNEFLNIPVKNENGR
jgi:hypothetical protein